MLRSHALLLLAGVFVLAGHGLACGRDTCTAGMNMTDPRLVAGLESSSDGPLIRITWEPGTDKGAQLPEEYFAAVEFWEETDPDMQALVEEMSMSGERELTVRFHDLGDWLSTHRTIELALWFPDRRDFISCRHPGMDDIYLLNVRLEFDEQQRLLHADLTQNLLHGAW